MEIKFIAHDYMGTCTMVDFSTTSDMVNMLMDQLHIYRVPISDWDFFVQEMLGTTELPPDLPANRWALPGITRDSLNLQHGERFQLLPSSANLAFNISKEILFNNHPCTFADVAQMFFGRQIRDLNGNRLYVPDYTVQTQLAGNIEARETMCNVGYLFQCIITQDSRLVASFYYRPYNTGFAESRKWPEELQQLRATIEQGRNNEIS